MNKDVLSRLMGTPPGIIIRPRPIANPTRAGLVICFIIWALIVRGLLVIKSSIIMLSVSTITSVAMIVLTGCNRVSSNRN